MNKIEKQHILSETGNELSHLKQEIAKSKQEKPESIPTERKLEITRPSEKVQIRESVTKGEQKEAEKKLEENLETVFHDENINKIPEKRSEQISGSKARKTEDVQSQNISRLKLNLPSDAPPAANKNRIKEANAPLQTMLEAKGIGGRIFRKLFGFKESDRIPENAA